MTKLLNPGPVTLTERVRRSLLQPDLCHREVEYADLQDEARARLLDVYRLDPAEWAAVPITASGTGAVEAMIASLVPADGALLVVANGVYGERMSAMASRYRIPVAEVRHDWMEAPDLATIEARLAAEPAITQVAMVHHETTTGRLNDLSAVAALCRARGVGLLVDGVSSFGAEAIDFAGIDAVAATANKCLHGVPGVSFVIVRRRALRRGAARAFYLDLGRLAEAQQQRSTPFTPAVHATYALVEALREFQDDGGLPARHARYRALSGQIRAGLEALGIDGLLPADRSSVVLSAYRSPKDLPYVRLHDGLKARGFVIYAGQGDLSSVLFRISTMGDLDAHDVDRLLVAMRAVLQGEPE